MQFVILMYSNGPMGKLALATESASNTNQYMYLVRMLQSEIMGSNPKHICIQAIENRQLHRSDRSDRIRLGTDGNWAVETTRRLRAPLTILSHTQHIIFCTAK